MTQPTVSVTHEYKFTFYAVPTVDQLAEALIEAGKVMGPNARVHISAHDSQRDGHTLTAVVAGAKR